MVKISSLSLNFSFRNNHNLRLTLSSILAISLAAFLTVFVKLVTEWEAPHVTSNQSVSGKINSWDDLYNIFIKNPLVTGSFGLDIQKKEDQGALFIFFVVIGALTVIGTRLSTRLRKGFILIAYPRRLWVPLMKIRRSIQSHSVLIKEGFSSPNAKDKFEWQERNLKILEAALQNCLKEVELKIDQKSIDDCTNYLDLLTERESGKISKIVACTDRDSIWFSEMILSYLLSSVSLSRRNSQAEATRYFLTESIQPSPIEIALKRIQGRDMQMKRILKKAVLEKESRKGPLPNFLLIEKTNGEILFWHLVRKTRVKGEFYEFMLTPTIPDQYQKWIATLASAQTLE